MHSLVNDAEANMQQIIKKYQSELTKVRTGRASASLLEGVMIKYYGASTPIVQLAAINVVEGNQLVIKPYDRNYLKEMVNVINSANLGFQGQDHGDIIRITIPPLTSERRSELVKKVKKIAEDYKIKIRNVRRDANDFIKKSSQKSDDEKKIAQDEIQDITNHAIKQIDEITKKKENDLLRI